MIREPSSGPHCSCAASDMSASRIMHNIAETYFLVRGLTCVMTRAIQREKRISGKARLTDGNRAQDKIPRSNHPGRRSPASAHPLFRQSKKKVVYQDLDLSVLTRCNQV